MKLKKISRAIILIAISAGGSSYYLFCRSKTKSVANNEDQILIDDSRVKNTNDADLAEAKKRAESIRTTALLLESSFDLRYGKILSKLNMDPGSDVYEKIKLILIGRQLSVDVVLERAKDGLVNLQYDDKGSKTLVSMTIPSDWKERILSAKSTWNSQLITAVGDQLATDLIFYVDSLAIRNSAVEKIQKELSATPKNTLNEVQENALLADMLKANADNYGTWHNFITDDVLAHAKTYLNPVQYNVLQISAIERSNREQAIQSAINQYKSTH